MKISKRVCVVFGLLDVVILFCFFVFFDWWPFGTPRSDRDWAEDQQVLAMSTQEGSEIHIQNVRDFRHTSESDYIIGYYDETYDISKLVRGWYLVVPFNNQEGPAHVMMSFDFSDGKTVSISPEIRKEEGESFSALLGLLQQYELVYMIGDDRDLIQVRTNYRKNDVHMYPLAVSQDVLQRLFVDMINRANILATKPEFYHTIQNSCMTALLDHGNMLLEEDIPWSKKILFPKYSDELLLERGLIDTKITSLIELREYYNITQKAQSLNNDPAFAEKIRPLIQ